MPNHARQFNGKSIVTVIHDPLLGDLQVVVSEPGTTRPPGTPTAPEDALAGSVVASAHPPTGPPPASHVAARSKGGRHGR